MHQFDARPGAHRRLARTCLTAAQATSRLTRTALRSLAVALSLSFVLVIMAVLTVAGGAEAHVASHSHHAVSGFHHAKKAPRHHRRKHRARRAHRRHPRARLQPSGRVSPQEAAVVSGASACPNVNLMPNGSNLPAIAQATLCLVNQQRRAAGEGPLTEDTRLDRAAQAHTNDMVGHGYFEHVSPSGSSPLQRMLDSGFLTPANGYQLGENIAWGTLGLATPASIVTAWMKSPDHRANILDRGFRRTGMGVAPAVPGGAAHGQAGATYTQDFGTILG